MKETLITVAVCIGIITVLVIGRNSVAYRDIDHLKTSAPAHIEMLGFDIDGYSGFDGGMTHGGSVYYICHRSDEPKILYKIEVVSWKGELQSYRPELITKNIVMYHPLPIEEH